jgi:alpha-tubulin suppressor-like RCC1 family protein
MPSRKKIILGGAFLLAGCLSTSSPQETESTRTGEEIPSEEGTPLDDQTLARLIQAPPIAVGGSHVCAVLAGGALRCWGTGIQGQLGLGLARFADAKAPPLSLGAPAAALALGPRHACALLQGGAVRCWGDGSRGQLGLGDRRIFGDDEAPSSSPLVSLEAPALQLVAGLDHTCALLQGGVVRCWGAGRLGQLKHDGSWARDALSPSELQPVAFGEPAVQLAAGSYFTCALLASGKVRCWGINGNGQLGMGHNNPMAGPAQEVPLQGAAQTIVARKNRVCVVLQDGAVACWGSLWAPKGGFTGVTPLALGAPAQQISLGDSHGCALLQDGAVRCWGKNVVDNYVYNTPSYYWGDDEPLASVPTLPLGQPARQVACGDRFTCSLLQDGSVHCLGLVPPGLTTDPMPQASPGGEVLQLVAEENRLCLLHQDGSVRCLGSSPWMGLGDQGPNGLVIGDDETPAMAPTVAVGGKVRALSAGADKTCALLENGKVRCWGTNITRPVPGESFASSLTIGDDETPATFEDEDLGGMATQVTGGSIPTCSLLQGGAVRCWDRDYGGALEEAGSEAFPTVSKLAPIPLGGAALQVATGEHHSCALLEGGRVRCWGLSTSGELGYPGVDLLDTVGAVAGAGDVVLGAPARQIAVGFDHSCALLEGGRIRCWGNNQSLKLGFAKEEDIGDDEVPAAAGDVPLGAEARQVVTGGSHTCALLTGGRVRCWGWAILGYPIRPWESRSADQVEDLDLGEPALFLAAGGGVTCAALAGGRLRCWGDNSLGQLGLGHTRDIGDDEAPSAAGDIDLGGAPLAL